MNLRKMLYMAAREIVLLYLVHGAAELLAMIREKWAILPHRGRPLCIQ